MKEVLAEVLALKFGLSEEEQQAALDGYTTYYFERMEGNMEKDSTDFGDFLQSLVVNEQGELDLPPSDSSAT